MFKSKIKKLLYSLFVVSSIFLEISTVSATTDHLRNGDIVPVPYYYTHHRGSSYYWDSFRYIERVSDGRSLYCIQPLVHINRDSVYDVKTDNLAALTNIQPAVWERIERIAYFGYSYFGGGIDHSDPKWYVATQMMIWQLADPTVEAYFTHSIRGERDDNILKSEIDEINRLVDNYDLKPSFQNMPQSVTVGSSVSITDDQQVLSNFNLENVLGGSVSKNLNTLKINPFNSSKVSFSLVKYGNSYREPLKLYYSSDSQMAIKPGNLKPIKLNYSINILRGKINISKRDIDTGLNTSQGDASLEGAIYGIYKSDGSKVSEIMTDKNGNASSGYLASLGEYYVQEISPSKGYELDNTRYPVVLSENNLNPTVIVNEKIKEREVTFFKVFSNNKTGLLKPEGGVIFDVFLKSSGKKFKSVITNTQGYAKVVLPYGIYTVKQVNAPLNYEKVEDFDIEILDGDTEGLYKLISNSLMSAKVKVIQKDRETNKNILIQGTKFKIKNIDKNEWVCQNITYPSVTSVCEFETNKDGEFYTPFELEAGHYQLVEVDQSIDGYLWNKEPIYFEIGENSEIKNNDKIGNYVEVIFYNDPVKGKVVIDKKGEVLIISDGEYKYEKVNLPNVAYELRAVEDVVINGQLYFKKGELVEELTTDEQGKSESKKLPLGKYALIEISTQNEAVFEFTYENSNEELQIKNFSFDSYLPKGGLEFSKVDSLTNESLSNTRIEIYTEENELIFDGKTNESGIIILNDLPIGKYFIVEREAPEGYKINDKEILFEIKDDGEVVKVVMEDDKLESPLDIKVIDDNKYLTNTFIEDIVLGDKLSEYNLDVPNTFKSDNIKYILSLTSTLISIIFMLMLKKRDYDKNA